MSPVQPPPVLCRTFPFLFDSVKCVLKDIINSEHKRKLKVFFQIHYKLLSFSYEFFSQCMRYNVTHPKKKCESDIFHCRIQIYSQKQPSKIVLIALKSKIQRFYQVNLCLHLSLRQLLRELEQFLCSFEIVVLFCGLAKRANLLQFFYLLLYFLSFNMNKRSPSMPMNLNKHIILFVNLCVIQNCHFNLIKKYIGAFPPNITSLFFLNHSFYA